MKLRSVLSEHKRQATNLLSEPAKAPAALEDSLVVAATRFWIAAAEHKEERTPGTKKTSLRSLEDEVVTVMAHINVTVERASTAVASSSDEKGIDRQRLRPWGAWGTLDQDRNLDAGVSYPRASFLDDVAGMYGPPDLHELRRPACGHRGVKQDSDNIRQYFRVASESLGAVPKTDRVRD